MKTFAGKVKRRVSKLLRRMSSFRRNYLVLPTPEGVPITERARFHWEVSSITADCLRRHRRRKDIMRHHNNHIYAFVNAAWALPKGVEGVMVEAGCYKGISSAKFSLLARRLGRKLVVFDSFEGMPPNDEEHSKSILGHSIEGWFEAGNLQGTLEEVKRNVARYGDISVCEFIPGWFEDTMPGYSTKIAAIYLDVDLASSTRTCLKYLYPLLSPGGVVVSQDGDFPLVIDVLRDADFWRDEVGCEMPSIEGLGERKMLTFIKRT